MNIIYVNLDTLKLIRTSCGSFHFLENEKKEKKTLQPDCFTKIKPLFKISSKHRYEGNCLRLAFSCLVLLLSDNSVCISNNGHRVFYDIFFRGGLDPLSVTSKLNCVRYHEFVNHC